MWRTTKDISLDIAATWPGVLENLDSTARLARYAGPGGWNDAGAYARATCQVLLLWIMHVCSMPVSWSASMELPAGEG